MAPDLTIALGRIVSAQRSVRPGGPAAPSLRGKTPPARSWVLDRRGDRGGHAAALDHHGAGDAVAEALLGRRGHDQDRADDVDEEAVDDAEEIPDDGRAPADR